MVKRAFLVGINYRGQESELRGCINDVTNVAKMLIDNFDFKSENITIITDDTDIKPIKCEIEKGLINLVKSGQSGDTLFFHYSGHGFYLNDTTNDEVDKRDEVIIPLDYEKSGHISDDWIFQNVIKNVKNDVKMWGLMDCCHSGTSIDLMYNFQYLGKAKVKNVDIKYSQSEWSDNFHFYLDGNNKTESNGNICFFSGCMDDQTSADAMIKNSYTGAFTYCLMETLKSKLLQNECGKLVFPYGKLKICDILKEINVRLKLYGFRGQNSQFSTTKFENFNSLFDL